MFLTRDYFYFEGGLAKLFRRLILIKQPAFPKLNIDDNPIYSVVEPSIENGENSEYSISFQSDLTDGLYSIFGEDDVGNKV